LSAALHCLALDAYPFNLIVHPQYRDKRLIGFEKRPEQLLLGRQLDDG